VPKEIQWFINAQKDEGLRPKDLRDEGNAGRRQMIDLYARYEQVCAAASVIDFGELLLRSLELLRDNAELAQQYQQRFQHVLVDEFQDTNAIQYRWLRMLAGPTGKPVCRRRRRSVDLPLARRAHREPAPLPAGLPRHAARAARAELPLDGEHPETRRTP